MVQRLMDGGSIQSEAEQMIFFYVGSPCGLPLFDHLRSIFLIFTHISILTILGDGATLEEG